MNEPQQQPIFGIEKIYVKDLSLEIPNAPDVFLSGAQPGALDYLAAVVSKWSGTRAHLAAERPAFAATLKRIESDPLVAEVFAQHWDK